jgi:two-component system phosphate regulon sensor histidine kinase PhoR
MFWRLFGAYGVLLLAAIALLGVVLASRVERHYQKQIDDRLLTRALLVREIVQGRPADRLQERIQRIGKEIAARITLIRADGRVVADSDEDPREMENHADRPEIHAARQTGFGSSTRLSNTLGESMKYTAVRVDDRDSAAAYVRVALPLDEVRAQLASVGRIVWSAAAVTAFAAMLLAFWLARRISRPIQELTRGAERIAEGAYGQKVYPIGRDETAALARTFNYMSESLVEQFAQLEKDRQQLRAILSGMVEGVIALDAEQRVLFANEQAGQLVGFQSQDVVGRRLWEIVRHRSLLEVMTGALQKQEVCQKELNWDRNAIKNLTVHAARLPGSPTSGVVVVLHDTTELRRLERLRQDFVANVSHELKTPLSVIKANIETLLDGAMDDPKFRGPFLEQIADQAERLHALILDLLSLARIESGTECFDYEAVALEPLIAGCVERHRARAESKKQVLECISLKEEGGKKKEESDQVGEGRMTPSTLVPRSSLIPHPSAWADQEALSEILDNLLDNALKYTPEGGRVQMRWGTEDGQVFVEVEDTGIGIPEADLPRIFERFYRVDKARSRELGGTGLGLSIVKHLVQAMDGSISATSCLGKGTLFKVRLPRASAE